MPSQKSSGAMLSQREGDNNQHLSTKEMSNGHLSEIGSQIHCYNSQMSNSDFYMVTQSKEESREYSGLKPK